MGVKGEVEFPDVSHWQGYIDGDIMASKVKAIILRINDAISYPLLDREFERNYEKFKARNVMVGTYSYWRGMMNYRKQADLLISALDGKHLDLPLFIDVEQNGIEGRLSYAQSAKYLHNLMLALDAVFGHSNVGTYSAQGYWSNYLRLYPRDDLIGRPLWCAHWTTRSTPLVPIGWPRWDIWQFTSKMPAKPYGVRDSETIDFNTYNGNTAQFYAQFPGQGGVIIPPPPPPPPSSDNVCVLYRSNVRGSASAATGQPVLGSWNQGAILKVDDIVTGDDGEPWYKVSAFIKASLTKET